MDLAAHIMKMVVREKARNGSSNAYGKLFVFD
jgi:hypothetical protein